MAFYVNGVVVGSSIPLYSTNTVGGVALVKNVNNTVTSNTVDAATIGVNTTNLKFTTTNSSDRERVSGTWKNVGGSIATGDGGLWQRIS
tara:strand:+ start:491 stop:757 length:267 start_codon:yes stop_codon:yes gene_type:complete